MNLIGPENAPELQAGDFRSLILLGRRVLLMRSEPAGKVSRRRMPPKFPLPHFCCPGADHDPLCLKEIR